MENKDIEQILKEDDGRELYETASQVKKSFAHQRPVPEIDVEAQWQKFSASHHSVWPSRFRAMAAGFAIVVCLAVAAVVLPPMLGQSDGQTQVEPSSDVILPKAEKPETAEFIFHDVTLAEALAEISDYYQVEVEVINDEAMALRIYTQVEKYATAGEVVAFLSNLDNIDLSLEAGKIIVQ